MATKHNQPEAAEQGAVFEMIRWNISKIPLLARVFHPPNGGLRHPVEAAKLVAQGVSPGVPDIILPAARRGYIGLAIEMKAPGSISDTSRPQKEWLGFLWKEGWLSVVCDGADEAWAILSWYASEDFGVSEWRLKADPPGLRRILGSKYAQY